MNHMFNVETRSRGIVTVLAEGFEMHDGVFAFYASNDKVAVHAANDVYSVTRVALDKRDEATVAQVADSMMAFAKSKGHVDPPSYFAGYLDCERACRARAKKAEGN
jgi:hypothetical protein